MGAVKSGRASSAGDLLTAQEACNFLRCGRSTLEKCVSKGQVRKIKVGGLAYYSKMSIQDFLSGEVLSAQKSLKAVKSSKVDWSQF